MVVSTSHFEFRTLIEAACATDHASRASRGNAARTLRLRAGKWRLPSPARWRAALELVQLIADPNRELEWSLEQLADYDGMTPATLRNRIRRVTGLRPSAAARLIGWEWVAERALRTVMSGEHTA
jgi:AraC-like DNA-binding protein